MKKILLCLCFVFAVGLLFSACGKDDSSSSPTSTTSVQTKIDGKNVKLYVKATGDGENTKWKIAGNEILVKASAVADPELDTDEYLEIDETTYIIDDKNDDGGSLAALLDGVDKTSEIQLEGQYTLDSNINWDNPQVGQYYKPTYKITKLYGQSCNLTISFTIKVVENF